MKLIQICPSCGQPGVRVKEEAVRYNNALQHGCKTIKDVQKYTKKNMKGNCATRNPLGKCCRNVFLRTISEG